MAFKFKQTQAGAGIQRAAHCFEFLFHKLTGRRRSLPVKPQGVITANPGLQATRRVATDTCFVERVLRPELLGLDRERTPARHRQEISLYCPSVFNKMLGKTPSEHYDALIG